MPQNSSLFPSEYSNLCPGTLIDEGDRIQQLEDKLLILRYQMLAGQKKDGQSIAELQNQSVKIFSRPQPPPTVGRSLFAGGFSFGGNHGQIEKLDHKVEAFFNIGQELTTPRSFSGAVSSFSSGIWSGGSVGFGLGANGLFTIHTNNLEAVNFETEAKESVAAVLSAVTWYHAGSSGVRRAFFVGSAGPNPNFLLPSGKIEVLDFAAMSVSLSGNSLATVKGGCVATQSATESFIGSGYDVARTIEKINHTTVAVTSLGVQLNTNHTAGAGLSSDTSGFYVAGWNWTFMGNVPIYTRTVESVNFATGVGSVVSNALTSAPSAGSAGSSGRRRGYCTIAPGLVDPERTSIDVFRFDSLEINSLGVTLSKGGIGMSAAGKL